MSPPSPRTLTAIPAELHSRLQADLTRQRAAGNLWLLIAVCLAVAITAYFGWRGLHRAHAAPTWVPMMLAAAVGVAGIVAAVLVRQRRPVWVREALASGQVAVMDGALQVAEILPQQVRFERAPRAYVVGDYRHPVLEESPGTDALSGFVPQYVLGPAPGTPLRLVWSAAHPGHLLQVDYPGMAAVADAPAVMEAQDWRDLCARPRAALRAGAWLGAAMVAGLAAMALLLPTVSRGFSVWLWVGLLVLTVWLLGTWVPALRMWLQRDTVRRHTMTGPVQEVMRARRNDGRQGVEHALFARVGGEWHLLQTAGSASGLQATVAPGTPLSISYAVLGARRVQLRHSASAG